MKDGEWQELHDVEGGADQVILVLHEKWSNCFFGEKCTLLHREDAGSVRGASLWKDQKWRILASLFNQLLPISNGHEGFGFALCAATSWNVDAINYIGQRSKQRYISKFFTWCKGRSNILD